MDLLDAGSSSYMARRPRPPAATPLRVTDLAALLPLVHPWGLDAALDVRLGALGYSAAPALEVEFALEGGAEGWVTHSQDRWRDSGRLCAQVCLGMVGMCVAASAANPLFKELATVYGLALPELLRVRALPPPPR
jgi:hypothetical protein